jgi:hypothetical protein
MRRRVLFLSAALGMVSMLAVGAPAYGEGRPFATTLTGAAEVPGPGDATPPEGRSSRSTRAKVRSASTSAGLGSTAP